MNGAGEINVTKIGAGEVPNLSGSREAMMMRKGLGARSLRPIKARFSDLHIRILHEDPITRF